MISKMEVLFSVSVLNANGFTGIFNEKSRVFLEMMGGRRRGVRIYTFRDSLTTGARTILLTLQKW